MFRYGIAIVVGAAITFGLLFLMQFLIATGRGALSDVENAKVIDFVRVKKTETLERKKAKPTKPPAPKAPPPAFDQPQRSNDSLESVETVDIAPAPVDTGELNISSGLGLSLASSDGDYLPIVKVAPVYPSSAQARGLEGYVIVEFTVTKLGAVKEPIVIESSNAIFNKSALKAVLKFKYKPRVVNGEPIDVLGVRNKLTFQMEK